MQVLRWLETIDGLTKTQLAAAQTVFEEEEYDGKEFAEVTEKRSLYHTHTHTVTQLMRWLVFAA